MMDDSQTEQVEQCLLTKILSALVGSSVKIQYNSVIMYCTVQHILFTVPVQYWH